MCLFFFAISFLISHQALALCAVSCLEVADGDTPPAPNPCSSNDIKDGIGNRRLTFTLGKGQSLDSAVASLCGSGLCKPSGLACGHKCGNEYITGTCEPTQAGRPKSCSSSDLSCGKANSKGEKICSVNITFEGLNCTYSCKAKVKNCGAIQPIGGGSIGQTAPISKSSKDY